MAAAYDREGQDMGLFKKKKEPERPPEKKQKSPLEEMDPSIRPGGVFMVQLLMKERCETPSLERAAEVLGRRIGRVEAAEPEKDLASTMEGLSLFAAVEHTAHFSNGESPVQVSFMPCDTFHPETIDEMRRGQMWDCLADRDCILSECKYCVFANDILGGGMEPLERANFLMDYLEALLELFPTCEAVYSLNSGKLVRAETIRSGETSGLDRYIRYIVNARFFNISGSEDKLVDTLGMTLLYLEDLQYHFHSLDPNWLVNHAYNIASYTLANRRPIKDGDTVDGVRDGALDQELQWLCRFDNAMVKPDRPVLDIHTGRYAAGNR